MSDQMEGRTCIITGANSGIGKRIALALTKKGARVVMLCRSRERGKKARKEILTEVPDGAVELMLADLSKLSEVREFVEEFKSKHDYLHVLINNAGIYLSSYDETEDGFARMMAINHFSPFLLTMLLLPMLKKSAPSRIINVNSGLHKRAKLSAEDMDNIAKWKQTGMKGYGMSKFVNLLTIYQLAERLEGTGVTINAACPGMVKTGIARHSLGARIFWKLIGPFIKSAEEGADPIIHLATSPEVEGISGEYFDRFEISESSALSHDEELQDRAWEKSVQLTNP